MKVWMVVVMIVSLFFTEGAIANRIPLPIGTVFILKPFEDDSRGRKMCGNYFAEGGKGSLTQEQLVIFSATVEKQNISIVGLFPRDLFVRVVDRSVVIPIVTIIGSSSASDRRSFYLEVRMNARQAEAAEPCFLP